MKVLLVTALFCLGFLVTNVYADCADDTVTCYLYHQKTDGTYERQSLGQIKIGTVGLCKRYAHTLGSSSTNVCVNDPAGPSEITSVCKEYPGMCCGQSSNYSSDDCPKVVTSIPKGSVLG